MEKWLRIFALIFCLGIIFSVKIFGDSTDTFKMFRGNAQHTGYYGNQSVIDSPKVKWMFKTGGRIFSSPIIDEGIVYFGSSDSCLYAVGESDGVLKWKFKTGGEIKSTPLIYNKSVFFISMDGFFYSLDCEKGELKWKFQTEGEKIFSKTGFCTSKKQLRRDPWDVFLSSAVTDGKLVFFGCGDGNLYALDIMTGNKVWSFKTGDVVHSSPALYKGIIYFGSWDHYFYALDSQTGSQVWKYATGTDPNVWVMTGIQSSAAIENDVVYFGCRDANLYALNVSDGSKKWIFSNSGAWVLASPAIFNNSIYYGTSDTKKFNSLKIENGKSNYSLSMRGYLYSSPAVCDKIIYFGSYNGTLYASDTETGATKWIFKTEANKLDPLKMLDKNNDPVIKYDDTNDSTFFASVEKVYSVGTIISSPVVNNGDVYFGSTDGNLYALTEGKTTGVDVKESIETSFNLFNNYPNPFNPETTITFSIPKRTFVNLSIYDLLGRKAAVLVNDEVNAGTHNIVFNAEKLSSGTYFYSLETGKGVITKKMIVLK